GGCHFLQRSRGKYFSAKETLLPAQQIFSRGIKSACRERNAHMNESCVNRTVRRRRISGSAMRNYGRVRIGAGVLHTERREDIFLNEFFIALAADLFDHIAEQNVTGIAVIPLFTRLEFERFVEEPPYKLFRRGGERLG